MLLWIHNSIVFKEFIITEICLGAVAFGIFELCFCYLFSFGKVFFLVRGSVSVGSGGFYFRAVEPDKKFNF
jgi:hypothetical protein